MKRALGWVVVAGAWAFAAWSVWAELARARELGWFASVDLLPLWLGARALLGGLDPNDPAVLERLFDEAGLRMQPGGFASYYPPSASVLALPLAMLPFREAALAFRWVAAGVLVGVGALPALGRRQGAVGWTVAGLVVALIFHTRPVRAVLASGQPGPLVALAAAVGLWALATGRSRWGAVAGVGAALKLFPLLLLPAANRRFILWFLAPLAVLGGAALAMMRGPGLWPEHLVQFVDAPMWGPWLREPAWVRGLWSARFLGPALPTAALTAWGWRQGRPAHIAAVWLAWGGLVMTGSHHYHEALVLFPALAWALAGATTGQVGLGAAAFVAAALAWGRATSPLVPPSSLHWVPMGWAVWTACLAGAFSARGVCSSRPE